MEDMLNINVSTVDYEKTSKALTRQLLLVEEMVHGKEDFKISDAEFAFGWHFFVMRVNRSLIEKLAQMSGVDFIKLKGKNNDKKFLSWLTQKVEDKSPRFKLAIKEEMESSKFGIF